MKLVSQNNVKKILPRPLSLGKTIKGMTGFHNSNHYTKKKKNVKTLIFIHKFVSLVKAPQPFHVKAYKIRIKIKNHFLYF